MSDGPLTANCRACECHSCQEGCRKYFRDLAAAREQLAAKDAQARNLCRTWAEDHTHAQNVVRKHDPAANVEGDEFGVPGIGDLLDVLDEVIAGKDAEIKELRGRDKWWIAWAKRQANESGVMMAIVERDARVAAIARAEAAEARVRAVEGERDAAVAAAQAQHDAYEAERDALLASHNTSTALGLREENTALRAADAGHLSRIDGLKTRVEMLTQENAGLRGDLREMARSWKSWSVRSYRGGHDIEYVFTIPDAETLDALARRHDAAEPPLSAECPECHGQGMKADRATCDLCGGHGDLLILTMPTDTTNRPDVESYAPGGCGDEEDA